MATTPFTAPPEIRDWVKLIKETDRANEAEGVGPGNIEIRARFTDLRKSDIPAPSPAAQKKEAVRQQMVNRLSNMAIEIDKARQAGTLQPGDEQAYKLMVGRALDAGILDKLAADKLELRVQPAFNPFNPGMYVPGARAAMFISELTGNQPGELGSMVGELASQTASGLIPGGGLVRGAARPLMGALGAGLGYGAEKKLRGEPVTWREMRNEALLSAIPQVAEEGIQALVRLPMRMSAAGRRLRGHETKKQLERSAQEIFSPPGAEAVTGAYKEVYDSQMPVFFDDPNSPVRTFLSNLKDPRDLNDIYRRIGHFYKAADVPGLSDAQKRSMANDLFNAFTSPTGLGGSTPGVADIGLIDQLRQFLNHEAYTLKEPRLQGLMTEFRDALDETKNAAFNDPRVAQHLVSRTNKSQGEILDLLTRAQRDHYINTAAKEYMELITSRHIMNYTDDGRFGRVNLGSLRSALEAPKTQLDRDVVKRMSNITGAQDRFWDVFERLQQQYRYIEVEMPQRGRGGILPIQSMRRTMNTILLTPLGRSIFEKAVTQGRGRISYNTLATIANVSRRAQEEGESKTDLNIGAMISNPLASIKNAASNAFQARPQTQLEERTQPAR